MKMPELPGTTLARIRALAWEGYNNELMTVTQIAVESGRSVDEVSKVLDIANLASLRMPVYQRAEARAISEIVAAMERLVLRRRGVA